MKNLSKWANKNTKLAIGLIVIFEITKLMIGTFLGITLPIFPKISAEFGIFIIVSFILLIQKYYEIHQYFVKNPYRFRIICLSFLFGGSFVLSIIFGNQLQQKAISQQAFAAVEVKNEVKVIKIDSLKSIQQSEEKIEIAKHNSKKQKINKRPDSSKTLGFIGLFLLSIALMFGSLYLSCALACGGYGVVAILTLLIGIGTFSGGFYFLGRAFRNDYKPYKEMDKKERKREWRIWRIIYGVLTGIAILLYGYSFLRG